MALENIVIKGARQHNLKNIDVIIPRNQLVVITGLSGSGKSSLAFDTIYAEGQRRYVESLSAYARQFLGQMDKPDVDSIEGLSPAIAIEQKAGSKNPRSTVATVTEIYDHLRLLYARIGHPHCPQCGRPIQRQTVEEIVDQIKVLPAGERLLLLSPVVMGRKGEYKKLFEQLKREGFVRVRVDGEVRDLSEKIDVDKKKKHDVEVGVDRLVVGPDMSRRLADSLETALKRGEGTVLVHRLDQKAKTAEKKSHTRAARDEATLVFSAKYACAVCGLSFEELEPRMFSFNSPQGACPACTGLGQKMEVDPDLVIDQDLTINNGAVLPWNSTTAHIYKSMLQTVGKHFGFSLDTPWKKLKAEHRKIVLFGSGEVRLPFNFRGPESSYSYVGTFEGVIPRTERIYKETDSDYIREDIGNRYMRVQLCHTCKGRRLKPESLAVTVEEKNIVEVTEMSVARAREFFQSLKLSERDQTISKQIIKEIRERLSFLANVGLEYLTLDRATGSLSGGEAQRIHLATQIGSSLVGVLYILDEPSIGLHQRDNQRLLDTLMRLRDLGNTVVVVEHDEETMRQADHLIDIGPGAGVHGGTVVSAGTPAEVIADPKSLTGQYLNGTLAVDIPCRRRTPGGPALVLHQAVTNNLKGVDVSLPLGTFICVTGVSGSGKSSLIQETLEPAVRHQVYRGRIKPGGYKSITGTEHLDKIIDIDQSPIGRTPRSNPATYTGMFNEIRDLFAATAEAKVRGYKIGRFSFNVKGGRCEACDGDGIIKIEMHFLPDVYVPCEVCKGKRYNRETLEVLYKGKNIAEVLDMIVDEAREFFAAVPRLKRVLDTVADVGLGYIKLGQSATTLSGGEAQRLKLSTELGKRSTGRTLYILDEPTTGLHFADVQRLLDVLGRLVDAGNTVVVVEHNLDVIKAADFVLDMGPEGGEGGGRVIAFGRPEEVARVKESHTGHYLAKVLAGLSPCK
ncbi:MAG: excinuclease ABC subunit UvrA [Candidatus Firestonebacteria bacterium]|nr:excinuclease ABC subunit UvrA [Candidatus Firestonebacteria bacterium]